MPDLNLTPDQSRRRELAWIARTHLVGNDPSPEVIAAEDVIALAFWIDTGTLPPVTEDEESGSFPIGRHPTSRTVCRGDELTTYDGAA